MPDPLAVTTRLTEALGAQGSTVAHMSSLVLAATHSTTSAYLAIPIIVIVLGAQLWRRRSMGGGRGRFKGSGGSSGPGNF